MFVSPYLRSGLEDLPHPALQLMVLPQRGARPVGFKEGKDYGRRTISGSEGHEHGPADVELKEMGLGHAEWL